MDILDNPQVSLIQVNELFHFTRYIYYTYIIYIYIYYIYPKYSQIWMLSATAQGCRHAADEICNIASSHEPCTWGKILRNMHFGMGINLHVFFCTDAAKVRSSPKIDMLRPWVPEDIQIHFKSKICCHNQKCKSITKSRCAHHRGCNKRILYPQLSNITRMLIIYLQICITMMSH